MSIEPGLVLKVQSGFCQVQTGNDMVVCHLRGKIKRGLQHVDLVAIGDRVLISRINEQEGMIEQVMPRKRAFSRMDPRPQGVYEQVFACAQPAPHLRMLDRFLVIAEQLGIPPIIIANKYDLISREEAKSLFDLYGPIGYRVIYTSAKTGEGINEVKEILRDRISALTGPSGVGKSSLATCIQPNLKLRSEKISGATGKGRHTTEVRELYRLVGGGYLADMPGLRALALWDIQPEELDGYFPEMKQLIKSCQYSDCTHRTEPGCFIRKAVADGRIHPERYKSYLSMRFGVTDL
jgi:ribosome biogenesis GTPase